MEGELWVFFNLSLSALSDVTYTVTVSPSMTSPLLCHGSIGVPRTH